MHRMNKFRWFSGWSGNLKKLVRHKTTSHRWRETIAPLREKLLDRLISSRADRSYPFESGDSTRCDFFFLWQYTQSRVYRNMVVAMTWEFNEKFDVSTADLTCRFAMVNFTEPKVRLKIPVRVFYVFFTGIHLIGSSSKFSVLFKTNFTFGLWDPYGFLKTVTSHAWNMCGVNRTVRPRTQLCRSLGISQEMFPGYTVSLRGDTGFTGIKLKIIFIFWGYLKGKVYHSRPQNFASPDRR